MSIEVRSLSGDFGGDWDQSQFHQEILAEVSITTTLIGINHETGSDVINIEFVSGLSGGELTALNTLISNHTPVTLLDTTKYMGGNYSLQLAATSYQTHSTLTTSSLSEDVYRIDWYYEYNFNGGEIEVQILVDDVTQIHHMCWAPFDKNYGSSYTHTQSGFRKIVLLSGTHTIKIQIKMPNGGESTITRVALDINISS